MDSKIKWIPTCSGDCPEVPHGMRTLCPIGCPMFEFEREYPNTEIVVEGEDG